MPITGEVDISGILQNLGDPQHGLVAAKPSTAKSVEERDEIFRASYGAVDMSSSMTLAVIPKIIWDVNGYYRALGIAWPYKPTRRDLRLGFQSVDGHSSEHATYCMKQLLNPEIRQEYDDMPLGSHFRDKYTIEDELRKLSEVASKVSEEEGKLVTVDDLMKEYEDGVPDKAPELPPNRYIWNWGYFALKSRKYDDEPLARWQSLLITELHKRGVETTFSIGYIGGKTRKKSDVREHDGHMVFFLQEDTEPTPELAETTVSQFMAHR